MQNSPVETSSNVDYSSSVHTVKCGLQIPQINSLSDICKFSKNPNKDNLLDLIVAYATINPNEEHIYKLELTKTQNGSGAPNASSWLNNCFKSLADGENMNCVVAGSYALWTLTKMFNGHTDPGWKPSDIDMFIMNRDKNSRHSPAEGLLDIVHSTDKTPEEVITNFDIPCCRVAFDMNYTFYVSIHALYSIITKKIKLPLYLKEGMTFENVLNKYETDHPKITNVGIIKDYHTKLITRMRERIKKYQSRGFSFQWYTTDYILPWIKQRFTYIDFDMEKDYDYKKCRISNEYRIIIDYLGLVVSDMESIWCDEVQKQLDVINLMRTLSQVDQKYAKDYTELTEKLYAGLTKMFRLQKM